MATDRTLVQIRERSMLDLLDLALVVARRRAGALALAAVVGIAPWAALDAWLLRRPGVNPWFVLLLLALEAPWATAPLTVVLGALMFGRRARVGGTLLALARGLPAMILYQGIVRGMFLVICVLWPFVPARFCFLDEVILLERYRFWGALGRSWTLSRDRGTELFGQWVFQVVTGALFVACFWIAAGKLRAVTLGEELSWAVPDLFDPIFWDEQARGWRAQVASWLAIAFFGVARFLTYVDQRIRLEGWEVSLRMMQAGATLEDPERW
ncbi:MAG TPA: hypothetical protein VG406_00920 [Isosphaeraceae bacterium]|jgi:hypothetical protein|nr:hypothetical protein [Isosphaeraceae bacterium]